MTQAELDHYRRRLLALKKRRGGDLSELEEEVLRPVGGESAGSLSDVPVHLADLGTENFDEELDLDLIENEEHILVEINDALARIEQGTFGRCENCHRRISKERLDALPYARYCIRCARKFQGQASR
jgi:RNA polymerase-binding transcription factor DksA